MNPEFAEESAAEGEHGRVPKAWGGQSPSLLLTRRSLTLLTVLVVLLAVLTVVIGQGIASNILGMAPLFAAVCVVASQMIVRAHGAAALVAAMTIALTFGFDAFLALTQPGRFELFSYALLLTAIVASGSALIVEACHAFGKPDDHWRARRTYLAMTAIVVINAIADFASGNAWAGALAMAVLLAASIVAFCLSLLNLVLDYVELKRVIATPAEVCGCVRLRGYVSRRRSRAESW